MHKKINSSEKYQAYPDYKDSGVEWLGGVPEYWQVTKLKYLIRALESGVSVNATDVPKSEGEVGVLKTSAVYTREFRSGENKTVFEEEINRVKCPVKAGSIIISRMNTPDLVGAAAYVDTDYKDLYLPDRLWQTVYYDEKKQSSKYIHYFMYLRGFRDQISNYAEGASSSMQNIAKDDFLSINLLLPSFDEQQKIANFLDHETAKIDTLIDKQQQLIKLLKEKRQAVISHAVTRGLNPDAPMKDSGVQWLDEVPEHWGVVKLKHIISELESGCSVNASDIPAQENEIGILKTSCVYTRSFRVNENKTVIKEDLTRVKCPIRKDAIIISRMNTPELVGASAIVDIEKDNIYLPDRLWQTVFDSSISINSKFLSFFMMINGFRNQISLAAEGASSSMQNIAKGDYLAINTLLPPITEQNSIVIELERRLCKFYDLVKYADLTVTLLQERRTALISAAVTGKIDVRNWQGEA
jgi:type I restriction enzyme S subunit